jgi:hypothetical protein
MLATAGMSMTYLQKKLVVSNVSNAPIEKTNQPIEPSPRQAAGNALTTAVQRI